MKALYRMVSGWGKDQNVKKAKSLTEVEVREMLGSVDLTNNREVQRGFCFLMGLFGGNRMGELYNMRWEDLTEICDATGELKEISVEIVRSKTDREGRGFRFVIFFGFG